jgi:hypothetical protein
MRIAPIVTISCALAWGTSAMAKPDWRARLRWHAFERPHALDAAPAPAAVYETADLRAAEQLLDGGQPDGAARLVDRVIFDSRDAREVCRARILAVHVVQWEGPAAELRTALVDLAARLRSRRADDDCRREADALIGPFAYAFDLESDELDPMVIVPLWDAAAAIATTEARRTIALHDRALVYWRRASSGDTTSARWRAAAIAAEQAAAADPTDDDMIAYARDARWNAMIVARNGR